MEEQIDKAREKSTSAIEEVVIKMEPDVLIVYTVPANGVRMRSTLIMAWKLRQFPDPIQSGNLTWTCSWHFPKFIANTCCFSMYGWV